MQKPGEDREVSHHRGTIAARWIYGVLLVTCAIGLAQWDPARVSHHLAEIGVLVLLSLATELDLRRIRLKVAHHFDMGFALALVALVIAGPLAGVLVVAAPDVLFLLRRRQAPWRLWAVANWVSYAAFALAGAAVLGAMPQTPGPLSVVRLVAAGAAMLVVSYVFARLILAVARDGARPVSLVREEFVHTFPLAAAAITIGTLSSLLIPELGVLALVGFVAIVYSPQLVILQLLRAPSVAALDVDAAAQAYRDALADELHLGRADRRDTHAIDALAQHRPLPSVPANPLAFAKDALLVTICTERPPVQRAFTASLRVQVVLVARRWAQLTARCTPALSHHEAIAELRASSLAQDAPLGIDAAARIVEREHALTEHVAAVPRLHRAPLPRALRHGLLPLALSRLSA